MRLSGYNTPRETKRPPEAGKNIFARFLNIFSQSASAQDEQE